jgi:hypothetical protein
MKTWYLLPPYTESDCQWLDGCGLEVEVEIPNLLGLNDSGWCDMATGHNILTDYHKIYIRTYNSKDEMWLSLRYDGRAILNYNTEELNNIDTTQGDKNVTTID